MQFNSEAGQEPTASSNAPRAFLFTDIERSTEKWEHQSEAMNAALARHDRLMRHSVQKNGGDVFKMTGDGVHAVFSAPLSALNAALEAQQGLLADGFADVGGLKVRIALHVGEALPRDGDFFGPTLNRLARMLSAANGGQVLASEEAVRTIGASLPDGLGFLDLGQHGLRGVTTRQHLFQLIAPGLPVQFPPLRSEGSALGNLPQQVTPLIGREPELSELRRLRHKHRLVTLVGPGGVGKTSVAVQLGREAVDQYPDGVWLLELAPLASGQLVAESLAMILGGSAFSRPTLDFVVSILRSKSLLLIIDNCEHLISAAAQTAEAVLRNCAGVALLATSRQPLAIAAEHTYHMPSLAFPQRTEGMSAKSAIKYPAIQLFAERARAANFQFRIGDKNVSAVAAICKRLDGIPLAIELTAPLLRTLSIKELETHLQSGIPVLSATRSSEPRQHTLQAVFDWSYALLNPEEQVLLRRLAVFPDTFTFLGAAAVTARDTISPATLLATISSLVDKSLVLPDAGISATRYRLLDSTRGFALTRQVQSGEGDLRHHLCRFMISVYQQASAEWPEASTDEWLQAYAPDLDALRSSVEWAFGEGGDIDLGLELTSLCLKLMLELSLFPEMRRWFDRACQSIRDETPVITKARLLLAQSYLQYAWFGGAEAGEPATEAAALFRRTGSSLELAECLVRAGQAALSPRTTDAARKLLEEADRMLAGSRHNKVRASCLLSLGVLCDFEGDFVAGRALLNEAGEIFRGIRDNFGMRFVLICLAENLFHSGEVDAAMQSITEAVELSARHNHRHTLALARMNLAAYLLLLDRHQEAREVALASLRDASALGLTSYILILVEHLALVAATMGNARQAARMLGYSEARRLAQHAVRESTEQKVFERLLPLVVSACGVDVKSQLAAEGALWTENEALQSAMTV